MSDAEKPETQIAIFEAVHVEPLHGRVTDAKNRVHVGPKVSDALNANVPVYIIIGEFVPENVEETTEPTE